MSYKDELKSTTREVYIVVILYAMFFAWWYFFAYHFGVDTEKYRFILGFPEWFFYSCIVGYLLISFTLWGVVHFFFKEISLDGDCDSDDDA